MAIERILKPRSQNPSTARKKAQEAPRFASGRQIARPAISGAQETPQVLQAKGNGSWAKRLEGASRLGHRFSEISIHGPGTSAPRIPTWPGLVPETPSERGDLVSPSPAGPAARRSPARQSERHRHAPADSKAPIQPTLNKQLLKGAYRQKNSTIGSELHIGLMTKIQRFNSHETKLQKAEGSSGYKKLLNQQYKNLHELEQMAHGWLRENNHRATASDRKAMYGLLDEVERHHGALVGKTIEGGHALWLPSTVGKKQQKKARKIWSSIRAGTGNIRVEGDDPRFRTRTLASLAKLLEGKHGRVMLEELNTAQGNDASRRIRIGKSWEREFSGFEGSDWKAGSWARSIHSARARLDVRHRSPEVGRRGPGSGSYVQIDRESPPVTGSRGDKPLHMPHYITLGHELGHALRNLRGESRGPEFGRGGDLQGQLERTLWTSPEEHENITLHENVLRAEHGLPARSFHKPPQIVSLERSKDQIYQRLIASYGRIPRNHQETVEHHLPELLQARTLFHPGPSDEIPDWKDRSTHERAGGLVRTIEARLDDVVEGAREGRLQPPPPPVQQPQVQPRPGMPLWKKLAWGAAGLGATALTLGGAYLAYRRWFA